MHDPTDPVRGLSLTNDPGQSPLSRDEFIQQGNAYHDREAVQETSEDICLEFQDAGVLPKKEGTLTIKLPP